MINMKLIKRITAAAASVFVLLPCFKPGDTKAVSFNMQAALHSESAILVNLDCDTVIYEKNADTMQMPGPLVNIMTAVVCIENCPDLTQEVTVNEDVYSDLYNVQYKDDLRYADIYDGDVLTYYDLLYAMMLTSSVEASSTIAYNIGGASISNFVQLMNDKAAELGLASTHFTNATGMYSTDQYTTARDMAKLTQYALKVPHFEEISTAYSREPSIRDPEHHPDRDSWKWYHSNTMMDSESEKYYYPGARGIKTGNLEIGGRNIVTIAGRDGNNYLAVAMKAPINDSEGEVAFYHLEDAETMFNWAFNHFSYKVILPETAELGEIPVSLADGNDYVLARPKEEISMLWVDDVDVSLINRDKIEWNVDSLQAPVKKGDLLGKVTLEYSGEEIATVDLIAVSDVNRSALKYNIYAAKMFPKSKWFKKAFIITGILCGIYILLCVYSYVLFKQRQKPLKPIYAVPKVNKPKKKKNNTEKK